MSGTADCLRKLYYEKRFIDIDEPLFHLNLEQQKTSYLTRWDAFLNRKIPFAAYSVAGGG